jgi:hypothetical protein
MELGFVSVSYLFHAVDNNGWLMIYHEGHGGDFVLRKTAISRLIAEGFDVAALDVPLVGRSSLPTICTPVRGCVRITTHNMFALVQPSQGHALRFFLEPVFATLSGPGQNYDHIAMMGLSGGGWATTLVAALDERIEASFPVAGSLPIRLRRWQDVGDWEQLLPGIGDLVSYEDLYVMGAVGEGRRQLQVLNQFDSCCFASDGTGFKDGVEAAAAGLGGDWGLFVDTTHATHNISPAAMDEIIAAIR